MSNRSAVLHAPHRLHIEDKPTPVAGPGEVVVQIAAVGICGSDVHYFERGRIGNYVVEEPMVIGHEAAGTIVRVGENVSQDRIGQRVAIEPGVPCRRCSQCIGGHYNLCPGVQFLATPPVDGAICEYLAVDAAFAHPVPDGVSLEHAAMAEPVSVGIWAARQAGISAGDRVLVTGAGPIGLLAAQVARAFGAQLITVTDMSAFRLDVARRLGFDAHLATDGLREEYDVLLECSGAAVALGSGMTALARRGRAVLVGMGTDQVSIDVPLMQGRELTLTGTFRYANCYPLALELISTAAVDVSSVITHWFDLDHTLEALTLGTQEPRSLKAVVHIERSLDPRT